MNDFELFLTYIYENRDDLWQLLDFNHVTTDARLTWDFYSQHLDIVNAYTDNISIHPNITLPIILANPEINWCWICISMNENITWQIYLDNPTLNWNFDGFSQNPNITHEIIMANLELPWNWYILIQNHSII